MVVAMAAVARVAAEAAAEVGWGPGPAAPRAAAVQVRVRSAWVEAKSAGAMVGAEEAKAEEAQTGEAWVGATVGSAAATAGGIRWVRSRLQRTRAFWSTCKDSRRAPLFRRRTRTLRVNGEGSVRSALGDDLLARTL